MYVANNVVDRNTATCMRTNGIGRTSNDKTMWWKVDLGAVYNIYSINILFKHYDGYVGRQRGRFAGFSLYVSNYDVSQSDDIKGLNQCYKDVPQLPPLNFTTICAERGQYVVYYNERLEGVTYPEGYEVDNVYTELCEVIVQGCKNASLYGSKCDYPCPINCNYNTCHIQTGKCFSCKPGWSGIYCNKKCVIGWFGINCSQPCVGYCKDCVHCNHVTGLCDNGCGAGWTESMCDKECDNGTYGYDCANNCSGHCLNNTPCNKQTACNKGYYGTNCSRVCSPNCKPDTCRHTDGSCTECVSGWMGFNCTSECMLFYGENCRHRCNLNCINQTCDKIDGSCLHGCQNGYQCDQDTLKSMPLLSSSDSLHILVGGIFGASVLIIVGVVMAIFVVNICRTAKIINYTM